MYLFKLSLFLGVENIITIYTALTLTKYLVIAYFTQFITMTAEAGIGVMNGFGRASYPLFGCNFKAWSL